MKSDKPQGRDFYERFRVGPFTLERTLPWPTPFRFAAWRHPDHRGFSARCRDWIFGWRWPGRRDSAPPRDAVRRLRIIGDVVLTILFLAAAAGVIAVAAGVLVGFVMLGVRTVTGP